MLRIAHRSAPAPLRHRGSWRLDRGQRQTVAGMVAVIVGLHALGFFLLIALVAPRHYSLGASGGFTIGIGLTAYTLGLRHAFDADHIAAIDNTTRKLMSEGKRPLSVGFWFSLGHSTIVFGLALLFAIGIRALNGQVQHGRSELHNLSNWIGAGVSGLFLYIIAALNVVILIGIVHVFADMRRGRYEEAELEHRLNTRGLMMRLYGRLTGTVTRPGQMYPIGILFGLGFDTASEVALLFLAAAGADAGLPFYAILCLPVLFAAGMSLLDTIDGSFMNFAYGWAFSKPVRKVYYNITITGLSVAVALIVGTIELAGIVAQHAGARGAFWSWFINININQLGYIIVAMFVLTWSVSLAIWRFGHIEERWSAAARAPGAGGR